ncbi:hypothetical protein RP20_CCG021491 [Aedes albopictus]|nr:hypothetical protein RP20_CCG021491 [Aedes albopictus]
MECSSCEKFAEVYGFQPLVIAPTMSKITADSSSEDEVGAVKRLPVANSSTPLIIDTSVNNSNSNGKKGGAAVGNDDPKDEVSEMLDKVMEAVRSSPTNDAKKGVSIIAIKKYLKLQYRVRKAQITQQLKPAMEAALNRKLLVKVSGNRGVLMGSVKLNPANSRKSESGSGESDESEESDEQEPATAVKETMKEDTGSRKRKVGGDETAKSARVAKRLKA